MTRSLISISLMRFPLSLAHGGATYSVCSLPPCGQGNRIWVNKYESLTERTESKSSEIPVLFTHMRLPCPVGGGWPSEARPGGGGSLLRVALEAKTPPDPPRCARRATLPLQGRDDELAAPLGGCPAVMRAPRRTPPAA